MYLPRTRGLTNEQSEQPVVAVGDADIDIFLCVPRRPEADEKILLVAPFAEEIERMVVVERFTGSRIVRELKARGYTGGETAVYAYLRQRKEARPDPRLTMRYETEPGEQGQFDRSPYTVSLGGLTTCVVVFCLTLGFSRRVLLGTSASWNCAVIIASSRWRARRDVHAMIPLATNGGQFSRAKRGQL